MRHKIQALIAYIQSALSQPEEANHFDRNHIFFTALSLIKAKVSPEDRVTIVYVFTEIEKTLSLLRAGESEAFSTKFNRTQALYKSLDEKLRFYLGVSFYPMRAYYGYIQKKYELAATDLHRFFSISQTAFKDHLEAKTLAICEQHLNLFRIHFSAQQYDQARKTATDLLLLAMYGLETPFISERLAHQAVAENQSWQAYLINSALRRYLYNTHHQPQLADLIHSMCQHMPKSASDAFSDAIKGLDALYEEDLEEALHCISLVFKDGENRLPKILRYILLKQLAMAIKDAFPDYEQAYIRSVNRHIAEHILRPSNSGYIRLLDIGPINRSTKIREIPQSSAIQAPTSRLA